MPPLRPLIALLGATSLGIGGCAGHPQPRVADPPSEESPTLGGDDQGAEGCFTGGPPDVLQARVVVRERGSTEIVSLIDVEAQGPRRDAFRACHALVERERELDAISGGALEAKVQRPCSTDALPAGKITAGAVLADWRHNDALTMLGIEALGADERFACEPQAFEAVQVATRRVAAFPDEAACERARERLEREMALAQSRASVAALEWLQTQIDTQRTTIEQACTKDPKSPSCVEQRRLLELLDDKRSELAERPPERPSGVRLSCHTMP